MTTPNQQQSEAWNGPESAHYVDHADQYDLQLEPFTDAIFERAQPAPNEAVLDVGCGCGAMTLAAARAARTAVGLDISEPLVNVASSRARAATIDNVDFVVADAQTHVFEDAFDLIVSQFGLMFFDDPLAGFTNLRHALSPGGRIVFVSWQGLEVNEWLMTIGQALAAHATLPTLGGLTAGPGMFALKDADETTTLLTSAGFTQVNVEPVSPSILLGGGGTLDQSIDFLLGTGITRGLLSQVAPAQQSEVIDKLREALGARYESGVGVRLGAAGWLFSAER
jgi:ubiquinone/menaquinone biosynthesis C-methylase UbiE